MKRGYAYVFGGFSPTKKDGKLLLAAKISSAVCAVRFFSCGIRCYQIPTLLAWFDDGTWDVNRCLLCAIWLHTSNAQCSRFSSQETKVCNHCKPERSKTGSAGLQHNVTKIKYNSSTGKSWTIHETLPCLMALDTIAINCFGVGFSLILRPARFIRNSGLVRQTTETKVRIPRSTASQLVSYFFATVG